MADSGGASRSSGDPAGLSGSRHSSRPVVGRTASGQYRPTLSSIRSPGSPGGTTTPTAGNPPFTPIHSRSYSAGLNSPRQGFDASDETFVFEFGSRYLRGGLGAEKQPRGIVRYGPEHKARDGDYSHLVSSAPAKTSSQGCSYGEWGSEYEFWQMDLRGLDLALIKDRIERQVRSLINDKILIVDDARKRVWIVAVPSQTPQPLLQTLLEALFDFVPSPPSVSLLTLPVLSTIAAGVRSGLVVDIGWRETTVTALYEYRETLHHRSVRAMKRLHWETAQLLQRHIRRAPRNQPDEATVADISFEDSEEVLHRLVHCRLHYLTEQEVQRTASKSTTISLPTSTVKSTVMSFSSFSDPTERAFFAGTAAQPVDEDEKTLPFLVYDALLALPSDIRRVCMARIIVTGGGAHIPGLKTRLSTELKSMVEARGWDPVRNYGSAEKVPKPRAKLRARVPVPMDTDDDETSDGGVAFVNKDLDPDSTTPAHLQPPLTDPVVASIRTRALGSRPAEAAAAQALINAEDQLPEIRCIESLGAWAGASLIAGLHIKGTVEIERERFLQHGLLGGVDKDEDKRKSVAPLQTNRQSLVPGAQPGQRASGTWSLGVFA